MFKSQHQPHTHNGSSTYNLQNRDSSASQPTYFGPQTEIAHKVALVKKPIVKARTEHALQTLFIGEVSGNMEQDLSPLGHEGLFSPSSFKAYYYLQQAVERGTRLPDLILCDYRLPDGDALFLFRQLKTLGVTDAISFIAIAKHGDATQEASYRAFKAGLDDFFAEDVDAETLQSRINFLQKFRCEIIEEEIYASEAEKPVVSQIKRAFDVFLAASTLLILSPLLLLISALIWLDSPGPIFYISKRVGTGLRIFDFYKFRSMQINADKELPMHLNQYKQPEEPKSEAVSPEITDETCMDCLALGEGKFCSKTLILEGKEICEHSWKAILKKESDLKKNSIKINENKNNGTAFVKFGNDPRVTLFGKFLRKTSLDEIPQLINVLKGDMSIVGNRPLPIYEAEALTTDQWSKRFLAPAGITGLWQVTKRGKSEMSQEERVQLDIDYADRHSMWFDLKIIFRTIPAMIQRETV